VPANLGIRPEHLRFAEEGTDAHVERVDTLYDSRQQIVQLYIDGVRLTAVVPLTTPITPFQRLHVTLPIEQVRLFDAETGARLRV
jgi:ABC-type sugar transport system ATPase subunit